MRSPGWTVRGVAEDGAGVLLEGDAVAPGEDGQGAQGFELGDAADEVIMAAGDEVADSASELVGGAGDALAGVGELAAAGLMEAVVEVVELVVGDVEVAAAGGVEAAVQAGDGIEELRTVGEAAFGGFAGGGMRTSATRSAMETSIS